MAAIRALLAPTPGGGANGHDSVQLPAQERDVRQPVPEGRQADVDGGGEEFLRPPPLQRSSSWCDAESRRRVCGERANLPTRGRSLSWTESLTGGARLYEQGFGLPPVDADGRPLPQERAVAGLSSVGIAIASFKGNIGANILYMPHAWEQGGWLVGAIVIPLLAALAVWCVVLLIRCREGNTQSYGDLMERATNAKGRAAVNLCVVLLQVGTCCSYLINVSEVLNRVVLPTVGKTVLICCEAALIAPLVLIRNVAKLHPVNMLAGAVTTVAIFVAYFLLGRELAESGPSHVQPFRREGVLVCVGIACFAFEGIGLVIPIYDSCRHPRRFAPIYGCTVAFIVLLITMMAVLGYLAFGDNTKTLILLSFPEGPWTDTIQLTFSACMLASFPLQLLPAVRIVESLALKPSRPQTWDKHVKSCFRLAFVGLVAVVSIMGSTSLDHFVSMVGAVCGLPLAFIFPAICHRSLVAAPGSTAAALDMAMIAFGAVVTVCVGLENLLTWGSGQ